VAAIEANGGAALAIKADVSSPADIERLFGTAVKRFGRLEIVVANAGVEVVDQPVVDFTEADFDRVFGVNAKGAIFTRQQAARHVTDKGRVIFLGSSTTAFPTLGHGLYGASKIAAQFLVEVLAKEVGHRGVTVNSVLPTATDGAGVSTGGARPQVVDHIKQYNPMGRMARVADVADAIEYLAGDLSAYVSGQHLLLSGGAPA
jgi:3-oxoacyl-[acyl-carrier protein] reductase